MTRGNYHQNYYLSNREDLLKRRAERHAHPYGRAKALITAAKKHAEQLNIPFSLSFERVFYALINGKCERTGINFDFNRPDRTWRNAHAPSIDRKDSFAGYTDDNVQIVITLYNYGKGQHTDDEFIRFCHAVAKANPI